MPCSDLAAIPSGGRVLPPPPPPPPRPPPERRGVRLRYADGSTRWIPLTRFSREGRSHPGVLAWDACDPQLRAAEGGAPGQLTSFKVEGIPRVRAGGACGWTYHYPDVGMQLPHYGPEDDWVRSKAVWFAVEEPGRPRLTPPPRKPQTAWERGEATPVPTSDTLTPRAVLPDSRSVRIAPDGRRVVAYAITVTKDGPYVDGAAVMAHSVARQHSDPSKSKYAHELVALLKPTCVETRRQLQSLAVAGQHWRILERIVPIDISQTPPIYQHEASGGCCGADELIKLHAWTLLDYHRVVHLDMDTLLLQNIDDVLSRDASLAYTIDWGMANAASLKPPVQGGFLVVKPDLAVFQELQAYAQRGGFRPDGTGWEKSHVGHYWGGATIQGLLAFFYQVVHPDWGYAEDHCRLNAQVDRPHWDTPGLKGKKICFDLTKTEETCPDCRRTPVELVRHAHFTICQKPWICHHPGGLCAKLHERWFAVRRELEEVMGTFVNATAEPCHPVFRATHGMCACGGERHYVRLRLPPER
eukprot:TRINITY_DN2650_c1_g1_i15.p2 TRINITY_DN2650_c1_g1~~TRINITY_DN2650_c1_g1_i15.p2  ORF type:complete len:527 (+),score=134.27 TRINITY_DN2650_c1_g1_i15:452-2032(+)